MFGNAQALPGFCCAGDAVPMAKRAFLKTLLSHHLLWRSDGTEGHCGFSSRLREKRCMERKAFLSG
jgi:hypothetical protein